MRDMCDTKRVGETTVGILHEKSDRERQEDAFFAVETQKRNGTEEDSAVLKQTFAEVARKIKTSPAQGGSTATVAVVSGDHITLAHLGDSPAILFVRDRATGKVTAHELLKLHDMKNAEEIERVKGEGGTIAPGKSGRLGIKGTVSGEDNRVYQTRSFGDRGFTGVSDVPEITTIDLRQYAGADDQVFLCVSSDGICANRPGRKGADYAPIIEKIYNDALIADKEETVITRMAEHADRLTGDNKTVLFAEISGSARQNDLALGVFDGHYNQITADMACHDVKSALDMTVRRSPLSP